MQMSLSQSRNNHRTPVQQQTSYSLHSENLFGAYKTLKQQQEYLSDIRNRIRKLQQNQIKTLQKCQNQSRVLLSLESIREQKQQQTKKIYEHKQLIKNSMQDQHNRNHTQKDHHKKSLSTVFTQIKNKRLSNYEFMKQKRQQNEKKLFKIKELDLEDKKKLRNKVIEDEKMMRESKMVKIKYKKQNMQKSNEKQIRELNDKTRNQGMEIQKLAQLQTQLLQNHSKSQVKTNMVKEKYESFINNQKQALNELRKKQAIESVYIHPLVKRIQKRIDKYNIKNAR